MKFKKKPTSISPETPCYIDEHTHFYLQSKNNLSKKEVKRLGFYAQLNHELSEKTQFTKSLHGLFSHQYIDGHKIQCSLYSKLPQYFDEAWCFQPANVFTPTGPQ